MEKSHLSNSQSSFNSTSSFSTAVETEYINKTNGIKISLIDDFICKYSKESFYGLTIADVNERFIIPFTKTSCCSYIDLFNDQNLLKYEEATVYIVYSWSTKFLDLMDILREYFKNDVESVIWLDLFCFNQNQSNKIQFSHCNYQLGKFLQKFKKCLLILPDWEKSIEFGRTWILLELYFHFKMDHIFEIIMPKEKMKHLREKLENDCKMVIRKFSSKISIYDSLSTVKNDEIIINSWVETELGFKYFDHFIKRNVYNWLISFIDDQLNDKINSIRRLKLKISQKLILIEKQKLSCFSKNDYEISESFFIQSLMDIKKLATRDDPLTLDICHIIVDFYHENLKFRDASELSYAISKELKTSLGNSHFLTIKSMVLWAECLVKQGEIIRPKEIFSEIKYLQQNLCLEKYPDLIHTFYVLGVWNYENGHYKSAENDLLKCYNLRLNLIGGSHIHTLSTLLKLGQVHQLQRKFSVAEKDYETYVELATNVFGRNSPMVFGPRKCLADLYVIQWRFQRALPMLLEFLNYDKRHKGFNHVDTFLSANAVAILYLKMENYEEGERIIRENVVRSSFILGESNPTTLILTATHKMILNQITVETNANFKFQLNQINSNNNENLKRRNSANVLNRKNKNIFKSIVRIAGEDNIYDTKVCAIC